jgi:hypothetical protein
MATTARFYKGGQMKVCERHDCVVVYEGFNCPLCDAEYEIKQLEKTVNDLKQAVEVKE